MSVKAQKPCWPFTRNRDSDQAVGLVGWWPGGPSGGLKLFDRSEQKIHCTLTNFATPFTRTSGWAFGKDGGQGALVLDGTDDHIPLASQPAAFTIGATFAPSTFACWFKFTSGTCVMFDNRYDGAHVGYVFWCNTGNFLSCYSNPTNAERDGTKAVFGSWHHAALTLTSGGVGQMYLDGVAEGAAITWTLPPIATYVSMTMGKSYDPTYATGLMEDMRFYNRTLTAAEIWKLYAPTSRWDLRRQSNPVIVARNGGLAALGGVLPHHSRRRSLAGGFIDMGL